MATFSQGGTLGTAIETSEIVDGAVTTAKYADDSLTNVKVKSDAAIVDTKLATISTAGKVDGAAITGLANVPGGAGVLPTANTNVGWEQLGEGSADGTSATLAISGMSARKHLLIYAEVVDIASASELRFRFNADAGANYYSTVTVDGGAATDRSGATGIEYSSAGGTADYPIYLVIHVFNVASGRTKCGFWQATDFPTGGGAAPGNVAVGSFSWNNTAAQITGFSLVSSSGNLASGTNITVYGKKD